MSSKNIFWWIGGALALALLIAGAGLVFHTLPAPQTKQTSQIATTSVYAESKKIEQTDEISKINIEYPFIVGVSQSVNDQIQTLLQNRIADFRKIAQENEQARIDTNKTLPQNEQRPARPAPDAFWYELDITYATGTINPQTVSVVFFADEYSGGAHGNKSFIPFNYDITNNKQITLSDVFAEKPDYLQKISDFTYTDIVKQMNERGAGSPIDTQWIKTGTAPQVDNFATFTIGDNSITVYISPYQVAPYALGDFQVTMPTR